MSLELYGSEIQELNEKQISYIHQTHPARQKLTREEKKEPITKFGAVSAKVFFSHQFV